MLDNCDLLAEVRVGHQHKKTRMYPSVSADLVFQVVDDIQINAFEDTEMRTRLGYCTIAIDSLTLRPGIPAEDWFVLSDGGELLVRIEGYYADVGEEREVNYDSAAFVSQTRESATDFVPLAVVVMALEGIRVGQCFVELSTANAVKCTSVKHCLGITVWDESFIFHITPNDVLDISVFGHEQLVAKAVLPVPAKELLDLAATRQQLEVHLLYGNHTAGRLLIRAVVCKYLPSPEKSSSIPEALGRELAGEEPAPQLSASQSTVVAAATEPVLASHWLLDIRRAGAMALTPDSLHLRLSSATMTARTAVRPEPFEWNEQLAVSLPEGQGMCLELWDSTMLATADFHKKDLVDHDGKEEWFAFRNKGVVVAHVLMAMHSFPTAHDEAVQNLETRSVTHDSTGSARFQRTGWSYEYEEPAVDPLVEVITPRKETAQTAVSQSQNSDHSASLVPVLIRLVAGENLAQERLMESDPYVLLQVRGTQRQSSTKSGRHPRWDESFAFSVAPQDTLQLRVFDEAITGEDTPIGSAEVQISEMVLCDKQGQLLEARLMRDGLDMGRLLMSMADAAQGTKRAPRTVNESRDDDCAVM
eukprot:NODE_199_length_2187_cov_87.000000_g170_i0.p1 GENE.NODE_199_length_2187_cov_87.000000_g170_i0~~NODE_199_length_2187_cov_87.000000_g170_i0.p1  ORF type:complete len:588 (+),score=159.81 NODE_199_length_2187_cov_87.000000_g170_i0:378-2141(+)